MVCRVNANAFSLGLSNATEEQQAYGAYDHVFVLDIWLPATFFHGVSWQGSDPGVCL